MRELVPRTWGQSLHDCIQRINAYVLGWIGFFGICTKAEGRTMRGLDARIRRRLRALLLKQWKRKRTIVRKLVRLGARSQTARVALYERGQSWWALSHANIVDRALRPVFFEARGL